MATTDGFALSALARRLDRVRRLSPTELHTIAATPADEQEVGRRQDLVREGERPGECILILEGFAARYRMLAEGHRQILSFHIPGDFIDLQSLVLPRLDHSITALSEVRVARIKHQAMARLCEEPGLARLLWRETLIESAMFREAVVNLGRRSAYQRVAHIFCELVTRLQASGRTGENGFDLPLIQSDLADATGLSAVHVNRVLQELRRDNLIRLHSRHFTSLNWGGLRIAAGFDDSYLHLKSPG